MGWRDGDDSFGAQVARRNAQGSRESVYGTPLERLRLVVGLPYFAFIGHLHFSSHVSMHDFCLYRPSRTVVFWFCWCIDLHGLWNLEPLISQIFDTPIFQYVLILSLWLHLDSVK